LFTRAGNQKGKRTASYVSKTDVKEKKETGGVSTGPRWAGKGNKKKGEELSSAINTGLRKRKEKAVPTPLRFEGA